MEAEVAANCEAGRYTREEMVQTWWRSACRMIRATAPRMPVRTEVEVTASMGTRVLVRVSEEGERKEKGGREEGERREKRE